MFTHSFKPTCPDWSISVFLTFPHTPCAVMNIRDKVAWRREKEIASTIKETLFDTGVVNPRTCYKADVAAAKCKHSDFSTVDDDAWCVLFRRAACEYTLQEDHNEVESRHLQPRGCYRVSSKSSPKPARVTTKVSPCHACH